MARARPHDRGRAPIDAPTVPPGGGRDPAVPPARSSGPANSAADATDLDDPDRTPSFRRTPLLAGVGVLVVVALVAAVSLLGRRGSVPPPDPGDPTTSLTIGGTDGTWIETPATTVEPGLEVARALGFPAANGAEVTATVRFTNTTDAPLDLDHIEVVPKELAPLADAIRLVTEGLNVIEADPVLGWQTTIAPRATAQLGYEVTVEEGPAEPGRLQAYDAARIRAEAAWLGAHPQRGALTLATPRPDVDELVLGPGDPGTTGGGSTGGGGAGVVDPGGGGGVVGPGGGGGGAGVVDPGTGGGSDPGTGGGNDPGGGGFTPARSP